MGAGWKLLATGLRGQQQTLIRIFGWSLVEAFPAFLTGQFIALALDRGFLAGRPLLGLSWLGALVAVMAVGALATRMVYPQLAAVVEPLRDALVHRVVHASLHAPGWRSAGADPATVTRLTEQVEAVRRLVTAMLRTARQFGLSVVATVAGITVLAPMLALIVFPPVVLCVLLFVLLLPRLAARQKAEVLAEEEVTRRSADVLHGLRDVLACQGASHAAADVGAAIDHQTTRSRELARASSLRILLLVLGTNLPLVVLVLTAPSLISAGQVSAGALVAAATYLTVTLEPALRALAQVAASWGLELTVVLSRMAETVRLPPRRPTVANGRPIGYDLVVKGLTFAYGQRSEPVLRDLDLEISAGEHLAVVGPSGAGKSTLADVLSGLIHPQRGQVLVGSIPLSDWNPALLRRIVALIPQEAYVFAGTLRENLTYLAADSDDSRLEEAVAALGLEPLIARFGGWDAQVTAADLAAGERQLVALARVYASPALVIVLDEATCHLDPHHEARVEAAFKRRQGSLIVVAHRISSALRADRTLLFDGATVQLGTHAELLGRSPLYAELVGYWNDAPEEPALTLR